MRDAIRPVPAWVAWVCAALGAAGPAHAALDLATDRQVAGIFSNACSNPGQLRIRLSGDVLDIERGKTAVKANRLAVSKTPPPGAVSLDFKASVHGDVKGGDGVTLVLTHNSKGLFARITGGERSLASMGPGVIGQTLRHCDPNRNALTQAPQPARLGAPDLLSDPRFKAAYVKALGPSAKDRWLSRLDGPGPELRKLKVAGTEYTLAATCKPHECADSNLVLLWAPKTAVLHGLVFQNGSNALLGNPPPEVAKELQRLWAIEWRKGAGAK